MLNPIIIKEVQRELGGFTVGRILPRAQKKMIGPFIFVDHMGPTIIGPGRYIEVGQHPHIGIATLTWLLEGAFLHKDSVGSEQLITPGSVNWMTAGTGIVHVEKTPESLKDGLEHPVHGYQIWVALPAQNEDTDPCFHHTPASNLPQWNDGDIHFTLVAGKGFGRQSPVPIYSPMFMLQITTTKQTLLHTKEHLSGELGICVVTGQLKYAKETIHPNHLVVFSDAKNLSFELAPDTTLLLLGGAPLPENRHMDWNFVHTSKTKIEEAKEKWKNHNFPTVNNETSYMPYPN